MLLGIDTNIVYLLILYFRIYLYRQSIEYTVSENYYCTGKEQIKNKLRESVSPVLLSTSFHKHVI